MMVITSVSERPVTEPAGTIGATGALRTDRRVRGSASGLAPPRKPVRPWGCARSAWNRSAASRTRGAVESGHPVGLSNDPDMAVLQLQARRLGLAHELVIVRGDQD